MTRRRPPQFTVDHHGRLVEDVSALIADMSFPVRCAHCSRIYDLGTVTVTARYTDCSMWKSPCCGLTVDDRGADWKSRPDYTELRR